MSHIYVDNELEALEDDLRVVKEMIRAERWQDAREYLEWHVIGGAENLLEELDEVENEY